MKVRYHGRQRGSGLSIPIGGFGSSSASNLRPALRLFIDEYMGGHSESAAFVGVRLGLGAVGWEVNDAPAVETTTELRP